MTLPNIIFILADDMGYGDMRCNSAACKIPTPHLDRLAATGMRFTDAHASTAVCTPSRYNILTGRYPWRTRLKRGIVCPWDGALIEPGRVTVAELLRQQGYRTACIGKWHLGWDWPTKDGRHPNETLTFGQWAHSERLRFEPNIDYSGRLAGGPVDRGFDTYFGVDVPNFPPYSWFLNDRLLDPPTVPKPDTMYGYPGLMTPGWQLEKMIPEFTQRAVNYIEQSPAQDIRQPFFLYFPLTSPHSPIVPNPPFQGKSGVGNYGDFVCEVDWVVGQVLDALERTGQRENTLLIFASDNGPEDRTDDDEGAWARARRTHHYSMGNLRGLKFDAWEGGHRVPFVASWPTVTPPGTVCDQTLCLGDFFATCAQIVNVRAPDNAGEDSVSFLPLLQGRTHQPTRTSLVYRSMSGRFALREGPWVLIDSPTGGDRKEPDWLRSERGYTTHTQPRELFHLHDDLPQRVNRYADEPALAARLLALLKEIEQAHPCEPLPPDPRHLTE